MAKLISFILVLGVLFIHDFVAVWVGTIGKLDDELWQRGAVIGIAYLVIYQPALFERVANRYFAKKQ